MKIKDLKKKIGSSLEANIDLKLNNELFNKFNKFDFEELLIVSKVVVTKDDKISEDLMVNSSKANGKKCPVCWKIRENECERHGQILSND